MGYIIPGIIKGPELTIELFSIWGGFILFPYKLGGFNEPFICGGRRFEFKLSNKNTII